jgi:hypothetical protein
MGLRCLTFHLLRLLLSETKLQHAAIQHASESPQWQGPLLGRWACPALSSPKTRVSQERRGQAHLPNHELFTPGAISNGSYELKFKTDNKLDIRPLLSAALN